MYAIRSYYERIREHFVDKLLVGAAVVVPERSCSAAVRTGPVRGVGVVNPCDSAREDALCMPQRPVAHKRFIGVYGLLLGAAD